MEKKLKRFMYLSSTRKCKMLCNFNFLNSIFFHLRITSLGKITKLCFEVPSVCHFTANFKMLKDNIFDSFWLGR